MCTPSTVCMYSFIINNKYCESVFDGHDGPKEVGTDDQLFHKRENKL